MHPNTKNSGGDGQCGRPGGGRVPILGIGQPRQCPQERLAGGTEQDGIWGGGEHPQIPQQLQIVIKRLAESDTGVDTDAIPSYAASLSELSPLDE